MDANKAKENEGKRALKLVRWLSDHAIDGVRPLSSAQDLATEYLRDESYSNHRQRIDALINWETSKNFTTGFVTGLGGLLTMPFALPVGFAGSWVIQARMAAAIARIYGHDLQSKRIRTLIVATLVGDSIAEIATASGIRIGSGVAKAVADKVSRRGFVEFSKRVGSRLLAKAGQKSSVNLMKGVPLIGGVAGGTLDAVACRIVGKHARALFKTPESSAAAKKRAPRRGKLKRDVTGARKGKKSDSISKPENQKGPKPSERATEVRRPRKSSPKKTSANKSTGSKKSARAKKSSAATKSTTSNRR